MRTIDFILKKLCHFIRLPRLVLETSIVLYVSLMSVLRQHNENLW